MSNLYLNLESKIEILNRFLMSDFEITDDCYKDYKSIKSKLSADVLATKLNINSALLQQFEVALNYYYKHKKNEKVNNIATLRLISWLDTISKSSGQNFKVDIEKLLSDETIAIKQVRALELLLRDLIKSHNGGKDSLVVKLNSLMKEETVQKWIDSGDETGVLSGTTFSELSAIFLDKRIFASYEDLFKQENGLKYDKNKIKSLRFFLEDIRLIRNTIAHNKKVSPVQIELLNAYYSEIIKPVEFGKINGLTEVDPTLYLNISDEEIKTYVKNVREDLIEVKESLDELSSKVDEGFKKVLNDTDTLKTVNKKNQSTLQYIFGGVVILLILISGLLYTTNNNSSNTETIKDDLKDVKEIISGDSELKNMNNSGDLNIVKDLNENTLDIESKRLAIIYFDNTSEEPRLNKLKKGLAGMLISDLSNVNMIDIVERDRIEEILNEQKLNNSEEFDQKSASQVGKLLGAEMILTGAYFEMFGSFRIDARFIDVETGKILKSEGVDGKSSNFFKLEKQLIWKIIKNLEITLSDKERKAIEERQKSQNISYEDALLFSQALEEIDSGNKSEAIKILENILIKNPKFKTAIDELKKLQINI
jgi:TolB-like protein